jgi:endoglucanase
VLKKIVLIVTAAGIFCALPCQTDFLKTDGMIIRNNMGKGDTVRLYGTNIGGWEIIEPWMAPMNGVNNEWDARNKLAQRFGWDKAVALKKTYLNSWCKSDVFARISAEKLNCVRLPILWCDYMDTNGVWLRTAAGDTDFTLLDSFVVNARKQGLYTIFDLHGAPGSQNNKDHSGRENGILLYGSQKYKTILINWWKGVANHFKGVAAVAGYDLINEPSETYPGNMGSQTVALYDTLYKEIRKIDPDHIIFPEGIWTWDALPQPSSKNWTNVVYELHWYYFGSSNTLGDNQNDVNNAVSHMSSWKVPCFVGEFNFNGNVAECTKRMSQNQINWTIWTYKTKTNMGDWGMYIPNNNPGQVPDLNNDSYDQIAQKWNTWDTQNRFTRNNTTCDALKAAATMFGEPKRPLANPTGTIENRKDIPGHQSMDGLHLWCAGGKSLVITTPLYQQYSVSLVSCDGKIIIRQNHAGKIFAVDIRGIVSGMYQVIITSGSTSSVRHVLVTQ